VARIGVPDRRRPRAGIVLRIGVAAVSLAAVLAGGAGVSHANNSTKFDMLPVGTTYAPPTPGYATFVTDGIPAAVGAYHASTGAVFSNAAFVENLGKAFGAGGEIHLSNVEMKLGLTPTATTCVLKYGYYGGEVSLRINGSARVYGDVLALNGTTPGGASIAVSKTASGTGFYAGQISMSGSISNFAIGGQELWVDELFCAPPGRPPPRAGALSESGPRSSARGGLGMDRLPPRQHRDQVTDLLRAPGRRLHGVGAKREREQVLPAERAQRPGGARARGDSGAQIGGQAGRADLAHGGIGRRPSPVSLGRVDLSQPVRRHAPGGDQASDMRAVDLTPDAAPPARRVTL